METQDLQSFKSVRALVNRSRESLTVRFPVKDGVRAIELAPADSGAPPVALTADEAAAIDKHTTARAFLSRLVRDGSVQTIV